MLMKRLTLTVLAFLLPVLAAQAGNTGNGQGDNNGNNANRARGKTSGGYTLIIAGQYSGTGSATVADGAIGIAGVITLADGSTVTLTAPSLKVENNRFTGTGSIKGNACTITGRVDLPAATDQETTDEQAITGRMTATLTDAWGKTSRIVGIQNASSRGRGSNNGNGNGNGNGTGPGTGNGSGNGSGTGPGAGNGNTQPQKK